MLQTFWGIFTLLYHSGPTFFQGSSLVKTLPPILSLLLPSLTFHFMFSESEKMKIKIPLDDEKGQLCSSLFARKRT